MQQGIDYIGVGVGAIIMNAKGLLFLAKRGPQTRNERHKWEFPGGGVAFGETLRSAISREILEEYGFTIRIIQLLDVVDHILPNERQHWVSPTFLCEYDNGTPRILEPLKCEAIRWFSFSELPVSDMTQASQSSLLSFERYIASSSSSPHHL